MVIFYFIKHTNTEMLDTFTKFLLNYIKSKSVDEFLVIELKDIISNYKSLTIIDENEVLTSFEILNNLGYITLKYNDGKLFCVKITEKGKSFEENKIYSYQKNDNFAFKNLGWIFFSSFLGGFLGCVILFFLVFFIKG